MTCTRCGETFAAGGYCAVCALDKQGNVKSTRPAAVPTISYLHDDEYVIVR